MGNTTFRGVLRSTEGLKHVSINETTGTETETTIVNSSGVLIAPVDTDEPLQYSSETGITAGTTQTQGGATALTEEWNNVTTVGTAGDGVALPSAVTGYAITVKNSGANSLAVWPASGDKINALAVNLAVNIPVGGMVTFRAIDATTWETQEVFVSHAPTTEKGEFVFKASNNDGDTATTLTNAAMGQATTISIPDPGAATANVVLTDAANDGVVVTATAAELNYLDIASLGTGAASKAVVLDAGDDYTWPATGILTYGVLNDGSNAIGATAAEINNAADVSARTQELTVSGAVTAGVQSVELNHASTVIAATIADASTHQGLFIVKDTSASGTAAHTLTLTSGTFNGTNTVATLNAPNEALVVYFDSAGNGTIVENVGTVGLSGP
jgi:hypothetical protein